MIFKKRNSYKVEIDGKTHKVRPTKTEELLASELVKDIQASGFFCGRVSVPLLDRDKKLFEFTVFSGTGGWGDIHINTSGVFWGTLDEKRLLITDPKKLNKITDVRLLKKCEDVVTRYICPRDRELGVALHRSVVRATAELSMK